MGSARGSSLTRDVFWQGLHSLFQQLWSPELPHRREARRNGTVRAVESAASGPYGNVWGLGTRPHVLSSFWVTHLSHPQ